MSELLPWSEKRWDMSHPCLLRILSLNREYVDQTSSAQSSVTYHHQFSSILLSDQPLALGLKELEGWWYGSTSHVSTVNPLQKKSALGEIHKRPDSSAGASIVQCTVASSCFLRLWERPTQQATSFIFSDSKPICDARVPLPSHYFNRGEGFFVLSLSGKVRYWTKWKSREIFQLNPTRSLRLLQVRSLTLLTGWGWRWERIFHSFFFPERFHTNIRHQLVCGLTCRQVTDIRPSL